MSDSSVQISDAEHIFLCRILDSTEAATWREEINVQLATATVRRRTETGAGVYVDFTVESGARLGLEAPNFFISSIVGPDAKESVELILYLSMGMVSYLEIASSGTSLSIDEAVSWLKP